MYLTIHTNFVDYIEEFTTLPILQFLFFDLLYMSYQLKIKKTPVVIIIQIRYTLF
jgi:hypothetical protein